jgi:predicted RecB family nuclease
MDFFRPEIVTSFFQCKRKAFLILNSSLVFKKTSYEVMLANKAQQIKSDYCTKNQARSFTGSLKHGNDLIIDFKFSTEDYEFEDMGLRKINGKSNLGNFYYEPIIFVGEKKVSYESLFKLAYLGFIIKSIQQRFPTNGIIINRDGHKKNVNIGKFQVELEAGMDEIRNLSAKEPKIFINRKCEFCCFEPDCRERAIKVGNISLLDRVTEKLIDNYEEKGIFNLTQLSYLFRPRRKNSKSKTVYTHKPELQALALRNQKVYIKKLPSLETSKVSIFIDIESVPEDNHYYLFGALFIIGEGKRYFHFWSNCKGEEFECWKQLLDLLSEHKNAPIYHYGSFELEAFQKLSKMYKIDVKDTLNRMININQSIFGKIYFPTYSNRLKELAQYLGFKWQTNQASGIQSIAWRYYWEIGQEKYKSTLIEYNNDDCVALSVLVLELFKIQKKAEILDNVDFADNGKKMETSIGKNIHKQFDIALELAHSEYDRKKIKVDFDKKQVFLSQNKKNQAAKKNQWLGKELKKPDKTVVIPPDKYCFIHKSRHLNKSKIQYKRVKLDLKFSKKGIRKIVIEYKGQNGYCPICNNTYASLKFREIPRDLYGHNFKAWVVFQRIEIQLSFSKINESLLGMINDKIGSATGVEFIRQFSIQYKETEERILNNLLSSNYIHIDETTISILGDKQYVWVLTSEKYTILKLTSNREASEIKDLLKDYTGVLITDFYAGYDSVNCVQQKCWVHLLRDLNNDLWKNPFDKEYENFVSEIRNLIIPILETFYKHGLKKIFFKKHEKNIELFYDKNIDIVNYKSELCKVYQKRFKRYKDSLFTFIKYDDINWHNNVAENRIRHICVQRKISGSFGPNQFPHYLRMLGIMHTCKLQRKSFLGFLLSHEMDIDTYAEKNESRK